MMLLLSLWKNKAALLGVICFVLLGVIGFQKKSIEILETKLAAKPSIETKTEEVVKTVEVRGPERIVEKVVREKGETVYIERTTDRGEVTTTTDQEVIDTLKATVAKISPKKRWLVGADIDPQDWGKAVGVRAGVNLFNTFDVFGGYEFYGSNRIRTGVTYHFGGY